MSRLDKWISATVLGLIAPVILMLTFWWGSLPLLSGNNVTPYLTLSGIFIGIVLDVTWLRKFIFRLFYLPVPALFGIAVLYSVLIYGFFMGFPVFNCLIGIMGAYIISKGAILRGADPKTLQKNARTMNLFSFILLFLFCISTAVLALREPSIGSQVQNMLGLGFEVTGGMIWALILGGGTLLLAFQYGISKWILRRFEKRILQG